MQASKFSSSVYLFSGAPFSKAYFLPFVSVMNPISSLNVHFTKVDNWSLLPLILSSSMIIITNQFTKLLAPMLISLLFWIEFSLLPGIDFPKLPYEPRMTSPSGDPRPPRAGVERGEPGAIRRHLPLPLLVTRRMAGRGH